MSENALEMEPDPEIVALQVRLQRMLEVVAREPELEPWQVAERFGVAESTAAKALRGESFVHGALGPLDPVHIGARFGKLVVLEILTSAEVGRGWRREGTWCQVVCDCGLTKQVRAKHLRRDATRSCGTKGCVVQRLGPPITCPFCGRSVQPRGLGKHFKHKHPGSAVA